ncbi:MAG: FHA domain-containing protein [Pseudomonadota bacterium]
MGNDKTKWIFDENDTSDSNDAFTETVEGGSGDFTETLDGGSGSEDKTRVVENAPEKTQLYYPGMEAELGDNAKFTGETDPVVGWLVVIKGPGLGQSVNIGIGMNTLGRDESERISLPFGDTLMSAKDHARIIYDDDSRGFFIAHGSGKSITKVDGQMVANTLPLPDRSLIELTKTTHVRFVSFCDEQFDWADVARDQSS